MNEKIIQNFMFDWLEKKGHGLIVPNVGLYGQYECDIVSVTKAFFVNEFEIKISRDDYLAEFRNKKRKHDCLAGGKTFKHIIPNYYYFVFSHELYSNWKMDKVPEYSGVIVVKNNGHIRQVKQAKRLHNLKMESKKISFLGRGLMLRYWDLRIRANQ